MKKSIVRLSGVILLASCTRDASQANNVDKQELLPQQPQQAEQGGCWRTLSSCLSSAWECCSSFCYTCGATGGCVSSSQPVDTNDEAYIARLEQLEKEELAAQKEGKTTLDKGYFAGLEAVWHPSTKDERGFWEIKTSATPCPVAAYKAGKSQAPGRCYLPKKLCKDYPRGFKKLYLRTGGDHEGEKFAEEKVTTQELLAKGYVVKSRSLAALEGNSFAHDHWNIVHHPQVERAARLLLCSKNNYRDNKFILGLCLQYRLRDVYPCKFGVDAAEQAFKVPYLKTEKTGDKKRLASEREEDDTLLLFRRFIEEVGYGELPYLLAIDALPSGDKELYALLNQVAKKAKFPYLQQLFQQA